MNNYKYWEKFYNNQHTTEPSDFAKSLNLRGKSILDMGCGNGRDTLFLAKNNAVMGLDLFVEEYKDSKNPQWMKCSIEKFIETDTKAFDTLYARFLFHAIDADLQHDILKWAFDNMKEVYIECRSNKGQTPDNTHERRLIHSRWILRECLWLGYDIKYFEESTGFAKYGDEDPIIIRLNLTHESSI